jgi:hypothetical protein
MKNSDQPAQNEDRADTDAEGTPFDPPEEGVPSSAEVVFPQGTVPIAVPVSQEESRRLQREAQQSGVSAEGYTAIQEEKDPPEDFLFKVEEVKEKPNA